MGFTDVFYSLIKDYHNSKVDEQKQIEILKKLERKAYLKFQFEWEAEINSNGDNGHIDKQKQILNQYSDLFLEIASEIYDNSPDKSDRMRYIATEMKKGASAILVHGPEISETTIIGNKCANEIMDYLSDNSK